MLCEITHYELQSAENKSVCMERFQINFENDKNEDFSSTIWTNTILMIEEKSSNMLQIN